MKIRDNGDFGMEAIIKPEEWVDGIDKEFQLNCLMQLNRAHIFFKDSEKDYRKAVNQMEKWVTKR